MSRVILTDHYTHPNTQISALIWLNFQFQKFNIEQDYKHLPEFMSGNMKKKFSESPIS